MKHLFQRVGDIGHPSQRVFEDDFRQFPDHPEWIPLPEEIAQDFAALWATDNYQRAWLEDNTGSRWDNTPYYLNKIVDLSRVDYKITMSDVLHSHVRTTGLVEQRLLLPLQIDTERFSCQFVDFGGARNEQKKVFSISFTCFFFLFKND